MPPDHDAQRAAVTPIAMALAPSPVSVCVIHVHNSVAARAELLRERPVARDPIRPGHAGQGIYGKSSKIKTKSKE